MSAPECFPEHLPGNAMQIIYLNPVRNQVWCQDVSNVQVTAAQVKELRGRSGSNDHLLHLLKCQGKFARKCNLNPVNRFLALLPQIGIQDSLQILCRKCEGFQLLH